MISLSFEHPIFLWYLISIPLLVITHFFLLKHTKKKAMKFANFEALKRVTGYKSIAKNWSVLLLRVLIVLLIIFAASGAIFWYDGNSNENDFVLAIDVSASMSAQDIVPTRMDAAKQEALAFVDELRSSGKIGLVSFGGVSVVESVLTDSKSTVKTKISELEIQRAGGTDLAGAIVTSTNLLLNSGKGKTIILLTDGSNTAGSFLSDAVANAIEYANENRIVIHAIGVGSVTGPLGYLPEQYGLNATYDETNLVRLSNETGGQYFRAFQQDQIRAAYQQISDQSSKAKIPVRLSFGLLLLSLLLIFVEWGLINTKFRSIP
ncbi:VWA domain-containing protein [Candidatus Woesearchaeota archaeon]|nr:MAG: VWA domain-containing protein [Candidatus Woesearchaeota archaeon]